MQATRKLWTWLAVICALSFAVLGWVGRDIYLAAPPIPTVTTSRGDVLYSGAQIQHGQQAWRAASGQQLGTVWGHGSYLAPDWSADLLHREAVALHALLAARDFDRAYADLDAGQKGQVDALVRVELRRNTHDAGTTLGFLTMAIVGALFQLLPVLDGVHIPRARSAAAGTWIALVAGTMLLASAVGLGLGPPFFFAATGVLTFGGLVFLLAVGTAIARKVVPASRPLVHGARLALAALTVTLCLGGALALYLAGATTVNAPLLTDVHAFWGLAGWVVTVTVSFQVLPMFQGIGVQGPARERGIPAALFLLLLGWTVAVFAGLPFLQTLAEIGLGLVLTWYACATLVQLRRRKRKADVGTYYWMLALGCLALASLAHFLPFDADRRALLVGVLVMAGFGMSAINGMLYKIVPFLVWYHLQCDPRIERWRVPRVNAILDDTRALRQWR